MRLIQGNLAFFLIILQTIIDATFYISPSSNLKIEISKIYFVKKEKIVVIGGGTGSYTVLRGLKNYNVDLSAVVSMMDSGGSAGKLRDEYGYLPQGDSRRCLIALGEEDSIIRSVFEYRFKGGGLDGHNLGNLLLTALRDMSGSEEGAIDLASRLLNTRGEVVPVTLKHAQIAARLENGQIVVSETNIDIPKHNPDLKIKKLYLIPRVHANQKALDAILDADKIVIGPGDLYTSVLANLLVVGIKQALNETKAQKIYVCNIMTKRGETTSFRASDFVNETEKYLGKGVLDYVVINTVKPKEALLKEYQKEKSEFVVPDLRNDGYSVVRADLLDETHLVRHDPRKLAKTIMKI